MAIENKVTKLRAENGSTLTEIDIQIHFDEMNADGWSLLGIDNLVGWYRFFWFKEV